MTGEEISRPTVWIGRGPSELVGTTRQFPLWPQAADEPQIPPLALTAWGTASPPPAAGATREGAMDRNPWTYGVMGAELPRIRADFSTDPASAAPGDARQYLIVDLDGSPQAGAAVGVDVRLAGSATVYSNDFGTTCPLYGGGHGRTVVKVPINRAGAPIAQLRLRLLASGAAAPTIAVHRIAVLQDTGERVVVRHLPAVQTVIEAPPPATTSSPAITATATGP